MADTQISGSISARAYYGTETPIIGAQTTTPQRLISFELIPTTTAIEGQTDEGLISEIMGYNAPETTVTETPRLRTITKRPVCMNLEATGIDPMSDRIICIACKNPLEDDESFEMFANKDERILLQEFLEYMAMSNYDQIIGWNNVFDQCFVLYKCMKYGFPAKEAIDIEVVDLMDIMRKGGQKYAANPQKSKRLNHVALDILGRETPIEDVEALKLEGDAMDEAFYRIDAYHIIVTALLYRRWINANETTFGSVGATFTKEIGEDNRVNDFVQCKTCRAGQYPFPGDKEYVCTVCGEINKA